MTFLPMHLHVRSTPPDHTKYIYFMSSLTCRTPLPFNPLGFTRQEGTNGCRTLHRSLYVGQMPAIFNYLKPTVLQEPNRILSMGKWYDKIIAPPYDECRYPQMR